jgi:chemotaxis protein CheX
MLGMPLEKVGPDMSDAVGEVCNMIAGNFKNKIAGMAEGCIPSPPTVVTGNDYALHVQTCSPVLEVRLLFESMPMVGSLLIKS